MMLDVCFVCPYFEHFKDLKKFYEGPSIFKILSL
jgi:hypothetical protein